MTGSREGRISDHAVEQFVGRLLQVGVAIAAAVVIVGGLLLLMHQGGDVPSYATFRGEPESIRTLYGIVHGLMAVDARSIIQFGLLLLIATPILRVAFTWIAFLLQRDWVYVGITTIVLVLLLYGLIFGHA
ncbi:MAG TPA: DUF1634 domain-containing protein [Gemmatimonadaceae bacterium]|jgi:uncharacterized membrane protein